MEFDCVLPAASRDPDHNMPHCVTLDVGVANFLAAVREVDRLKDADVKIYQICSF